MGMGRGFSSNDFLSFFGLFGPPCNVGDDLLGLGKLPEILATIFEAGDIPHIFGKNVDQRIIQNI